MIRSLRTLPIVFHYVNPVTKVTVVNSPPSTKSPNGRTGSLTLLRRCSASSECSKVSLPNFVPDSSVEVIDRPQSIYFRPHRGTIFNCYHNRRKTAAVNTCAFFCTQIAKDIKMNQLNQAKNIFRKANAICFDVDSTVIQEEAIDELAKFCGKGDEVQQLTMEAMKGGMDFRQALAIRLDIIRPTASQLRSYIHGQKHRLTPYVKELIHELHKREKEVYLISGGFKSIIEPIARDLDISTSNVIANKLKFFYDGEYAGFCDQQPTSRSGGKGAAVRNLKEKHGYETVVMVGDGITDWEAAPPADLFIGFGGNAYRNEVKNKSKWYVTDFRDLINELRD